jgi:hypothetical protein
MEMFSRKLSLLGDAVFSAGRDAATPPGGATVFLSVSSAVARAAVFRGRGADLRAAWDAASAEARAYVSSTAAAAFWVKADVVTWRGTVSREDFAAELSRRPRGNAGAYAYPYGVAFDDDLDAALLSDEFNGCDVWGFERGEGDFKLENLVGYLKTKGAGLAAVPGRLVKFKCSGHVVDERDGTFGLRRDDENQGRRVTGLTRDAVAGLIRGSTDLLLRDQKADGSFVYGYVSGDVRTLTNYNVLRHAGGALSLMQRASLFGEDLGEEIGRAVDFFMRRLRRKGRAAFVADGDEIKLGGNGICAVVLASYGEFFGANPYAGTVRELADGILEMQEPDGSFYHVLDASDFSRKERDRIVYYDGEATYALVKAYALTGDARYLDAAERAVGRFIDGGYERFRDHWVAYSMNEITKHVPKREYFDFALWNAWSNLSVIFNQPTPYHTYFELLMATFDAFERLKGLSGSGGPRVPDFFDETDFARAIWKRATYMLNYYYYPEVAMYMKTPLRTLYSFNVRHHDWRVRIDDVQHFVGGYYEFYVNYRRLAEYLGDRGVSDEAVDEFLGGFGAGLDDALT